MDKLKTPSKYNKIAEMLNSLTGSKSLWQVFNDCIEMYALAIQNSFTVGKKYICNEKRYKQIAEQYTRNQIELIADILVELTGLLEENPYQDLLGDLYMRLDMGENSLGQFFTPYSVSQMMAQITLDMTKVKKEISDNGYVVLNEPCVGGGANIIAACEQLRINNINFQTQCIIVCQDLSRLTAMMCYVALSLIGCSAIVKVGDTLSNPYTNYYNELQKGSEIWTTPMFHINNCYKKV